MENIPDVSIKPFEFNSNSLEFIPSSNLSKPTNSSIPQPESIFPSSEVQAQSKKKPKSTLYDYLSQKQNKSKKINPNKQEGKKDENRMIKAHIIIDGEVVTAKIAKKDLYSGAYQVVQRKTTKLKKIIKESRKEEGIPPNQRPLCSQLQYREYVDQMLTQDLDLAIQELLEKLKFYYDRKKLEKTNKKVNKRYVKGFKECVKRCCDGSMKLLIMAPDIEKVEGQGGLDEMIYELLGCCNEKKVPVVFGLSMRSLGFTLINGAALLSVVGILDYSACESLFQTVLTLLDRNRSQYKSYCFDSSNYYIAS